MEEAGNIYEANLISSDGGEGGFVPLIEPTILRIDNTSYTADSTVTIDTRIISAQ